MMTLKKLLLMSFSLGLVGCAHKADPMAGSSDAMATTMSSTMPTTAPAHESLIDRAKDMIKKGETLLAKGKSDGSSDEQSSGQKMIDEGKALLQKANFFGNK